MLECKVGSTKVAQKSKKKFKIEFGFQRNWISEILPDLVHV